MHIHRCLSGTDALRTGVLDTDWILIDFFLHRYAEGSESLLCYSAFEIHARIYVINTSVRQRYYENMNNKKELPPAQREELLKTLKARFTKNMNRHKGVVWEKVQTKLETKAEKLQSLGEMEATGGEPDVVGQIDGDYVFIDCSAETPKGRRSICYDRQARVTRKEHAPKSSAIEMADAMGIELLSEDQYRKLQKLGEFDTKTSSWVQAPANIRRLGGAIFCDRRYDTVFTYHNGADSYYGSRGFRGSLRV